MNDRKEQSAKAEFGIPGLDDILLGGLRRNRLFLFEGSPGSGKTTLALQFLLEGAQAGKKASTSRCRRPRQSSGRLHFPTGGPSTVA